MAKEPLGTKGARLTCHVTMAGRFLVFMPTVDHVGVSRKIESREERVAPARHRPRVPREERLHRRGDHPHRHRRPARARTSSTTSPTSSRSGTSVRQRAESVRPPAVIYREQGLVTKLLRDLLTDDYTAIRIDDKPEYQRVIEMVERVMPALPPG